MLKLFYWLLALMLLLFIIFFAHKDSIIDRIKLFSLDHSSTIDKKREDALYVPSLLSPYEQEIPNDLMNRRFNLDGSTLVLPYEQEIPNDLMNRRFNLDGSTLVLPDEEDILLKARKEYSDNQLATDGLLGSTQMQNRLAVTLVKLRKICATTDLTIDEIDQILADSLSISVEEYRSIWLNTSLYDTVSELSKIYPDLAWVAWDVFLFHNEIELIYEGC